MTSPDPIVRGAPSSLATAEHLLRKQLSDQLAAVETAADVEQCIRLDFPAHLYLSVEQAKSYLHTVSQPVFQNQIYEPLLSTLRECAHDLLTPAGDAVDFFDLGPGKPVNTVPLLQELMQRDCVLRYIPVDISTHFLGITVQHVAPLQLDIHPLNVLFHDLPEILDSPPLESDCFAVFNLGLTFSNFGPADILTLLSDLLRRRSGLAIIATQLIDYSSATDLLTPYRTPDAQHFNSLVLKPLGLPIDAFKYNVRLAGECIEMGFIASKHVEVEACRARIPKGCRILTSVSYRYHQSTLKQVLSKYFSNVQLITRSDTAVCIGSLRHGESK